MMEISVLDLDNNPRCIVWVEDRLPIVRPVAGNIMDVVDAKFDFVTRAVHID